MNNTALRAQAQSADSHKVSFVKSDRMYGEQHMVFESVEHRTFYREKLARARYMDCYHESLIYILGISEDTRRHFDEIYDLKSGYIKPDCLKAGWITSGSACAVRLAFNLYTGGTPSVDERSDIELQLKECRRYSADDIFCCDYAPFFWEGIRLRYPEYCCPLEWDDAFLAYMEEIENAEGKTDGNEE